MTEPTFTPIHPAFVGKFPIYKQAGCREKLVSTDAIRSLSNMFLVDLERGICTCQWGQPFIVGDDGKILAQSYCVHKLKAMGDLVEKNPDELTWPYIKALATRYNKYEVVSAFHKELRRGDYDRAIYWACILSTTRGLKGIIKYMINILYEETRDHELGAELLGVYERGEFTIANVCKYVSLFCVSTKKWFLEGRYAIFEAEMAGYRELAKKYSYDVAQGKEIIPAEALPKLTQQLISGFANANREQVQYGLKGLFKCKSTQSHIAHKDYIFSLLEKVLSRRYPNGFTVHDSKVTYLHDFLKRRADVMGEHGYHELNAFADMLCGESYDYGLASQHRKALALKLIKSPIIPMGIVKQIPLYAHDNHTWSGKAFLKAYSYQLSNGVDQVNIDFRWCGAYLGVAYRYIAVKQHGSMDVAWKDVKWPQAMHTHVLKMFY